MDQNRRNIILRFIEHLKQLKINDIFDIGPGQGDISKILLDNDLEVAGIGIDNNNNIQGLCSKYKKYSFIHYDINNKPKNIQPKNALIASHILEHLNNPISFLNDCYSMLKDNGQLCIIVPPFKNDVVSRHIFVGWNTGHLMALLLRCGFNIKDGKYIKLGYNIAAIVSKGQRINMNSDDELLVNFKDKFPHSIAQQIDKNKRKDCNGFYSYFNGNINKLNW